MNDAPKRVEEMVEAAARALCRCECAFQCSPGICITPKAHLGDYLGEARAALAAALRSAPRDAEMRRWDRTSGQARRLPMSELHYLADTIEKGGKGT